MAKPVKIVVLAVITLALAFLFTRPSDYRNIARDVGGTLEDQWCAWAEVVGHQCDRWRHARRLIDEARRIGDDIGSRLPETPPLEDATSRQD